MRPNIPPLRAVARRTLPASSSRPRIPLPQPRLPSQPSHLRSASGIPNPLSWISQRLATRNPVTETAEEREEREAREAKEAQAAKKRAIEKGEGSIFDMVKGGETAKKLAKIHTQHKYSTAWFKISPRKLNMLGRQISGKPIEHAILQMEFSPKRAARRLKSVLCTALDHAEKKGLRHERLVVSEAWVNKGTPLKRLDIKARGRRGVKEHPQAKMHVVLREGKTREEKIEEKHRAILRKVKSPGLFREDIPIRNPGAMYAW